MPSGSLATPASVIDIALGGTVDALVVGDVMVMTGGALR